MSSCGDGIGSESSYGPERISDNVQITKLIEMAVEQALLKLVFGPRDNPEDFRSDRDWSQGIVFKAYNNVLRNPAYQSIYFISVVLLILINGLYFTLGLSGVTLETMIKNMLKIFVIGFFLNPLGTNQAANGWYVYLSFVVKSVLETAGTINIALIARLTGASMDDITSPFAPLDLVWGILFGKVVWLKLLSLMFIDGLSNWFLVFVVVMFSLFTLLIVMAEAMVLYISMMISIALLLSVGPLFIMCAMFSKTKSYFDKWAKGLTGLFVQQYIMFIGLTVFAFIVYGFIAAMLGFASIVEPVLKVDLTVPTPEWIKTIVNGIVDIMCSICGLLFSCGGLCSWRMPDYIIDITIPLVYFLMAVGGGMGYMASANITQTVNVASAASLFVITMSLARWLQANEGIAAEITGGAIKGSKLAEAALKKLDGAKAAVQQAATSAIKQGYTKGPVKMLKDGLKSLNAKFQKLKDNKETGLMGDLSRFAGKYIGGAVSGLSKGVNLYQGNAIVSLAKLGYAKGRGPEAYAKAKQKLLDEISSTETTDEHTQKIRATEKNNKIAKKAFSESYAANFAEAKADGLNDEEANERASTMAKADAIKAVREKGVNYKSADKKFSDADSDNDIADGLKYSVKSKGGIVNNLTDKVKGKINQAITKAQVKNSAGTGIKQSIKRSAIAAVSSGEGSAASFMQNVAGKNIDDMNYDPDLANQNDDGLEERNAINQAKPEADDDIQKRNDEQIAKAGAT